MICYYAILKAGGTVVNFNPLYAEREIARQIEDSEASIMITLDLNSLYSKIATFEIEFLQRDLKLMGASQYLNGESFVELDNSDLIER